MSSKTQSKKADGYLGIMVSPSKQTRKKKKKKKALLLFPEAYLIVMFIYANDK